MKLYGRHRSRELAKARLAELQRENPGAEVSIMARRSGSGRFSKHGTYFTFLVEPRKEIEDLDQFFREYDDAEDYDTQEYESSADYHTD